MKRIQIFLVEDSTEFREVLAFGLSDEPDMMIVGQFNTADAALSNLEGLREDRLPDLILLDLNLPGISGLEAVPRFKKICSSAEILILTESDRRADVLSAISSGAIGYLLKESSLDQITNGIRTVMNGGASLDPVMARYVVNSTVSVTADHAPQLSAREHQILYLLAHGKLQKQIAGELGISPKTVGFHIGHLYNKLEVQNGPAAIHKAHHLGLLRPPE